MILQVILEGLGLGALLVLVCAVGIRKGAVGMVHLYSLAVQRRCSGGAGGNDDSTVTGKTLPSAAFSGFLPSSATA